VDGPASTALSIWHISSIVAFSFSSSADFLVDHWPIVLTNWPTVRLGPFDHRRIVLTVLSFHQSANCALLFYQLPLFTLFDLFFQKKRCQQVPRM
jgi:hypothetical protein